MLWAYAVNEQRGSEQESAVDGGSGSEAFQGISGKGVMARLGPPTLVRHSQRIENNVAMHQKRSLTASLPPVAGYPAVSEIGIAPMDEVRFGSESISSKPPLAHTFPFSCQPDSLYAAATGCCMGAGSPSRPVPERRTFACKIGTRRANQTSDPSPESLPQRTMIFLDLWSGDGSFFSAHSHAHLTVSSG